MCSAQVIKELTETKGNIYEYFGLTIDFSGRYNPNIPNKNRQVVFTMYHYIKDIIGSTQPDMNNVTPDPAKFKSFTVHKRAPLMGFVPAEFIHGRTARFFLLQSEQGLVFK